MADLALFQIRKRPIFFLSVLYRSGVLCVFTLFMLFGNFSRLIPLQGFPSSLSVLEFALYALTLPVYVMRLRKSHLLALGILLSSVYGAVIHGFDWISSLYAMKLVGMIGAAVVLGELFASQETLIRFFLRLFFWVSLLGFVIFLGFPKAENFFLFLEGFGIQFHGDPHMRRFISPFFDPNYYAAIACFPLLLSYMTKRWGLFALLLLSIALTFSRSGIATCGILLAVVFMRARGKLSLQGLLIVGLCFIPILFPKELSHLWRRTFHLLEDPSAIARFETFRIAFAIFWEHPFFGVGYNYLTGAFEEAFGRLSPDSSVLVALINFGLIPCLVMIFGAVWWSINHIWRKGVVSLVYIYVAICILFTSLFNNLLFYPYWLIPIGALLTRIGGDRHASSTDSRLAHPHGRSREGARGLDRNIPRPRLHADQR